MNKRIIYIDTDISLGTPGAEIDDGAALIILLKSNEITPAGIGSVFGNVSEKDTCLNLSRMVHLLGKDEIPLASGEQCPLLGDMDWFSDWKQGYGETLAWEMNPLEENSADMLIRLAKEKPGKLTVLSIGPMTNLALALNKAPEIDHLIKEVVVMGGSFGTEPSSPEFNLKCDPQAAQIVFDASWPITIFGLEITRQVLFTRQMFGAIQTDDPAVQLLKNSAEKWIERVESMGWEQGGCSLHDAVAAAYLIDPDLFGFKSIGPIKIDLDSGEKMGTAVINKISERNVNIRIAANVKVEECRDLIWSRISG